MKLQSRHLGNSSHKRKGPAKNGRADISTGTNVRERDLSVLHFIYSNAENESSADPQDVEVAGTAASPALSAGGSVCGGCTVSLREAFRANQNDAVILCVER